jgi:hypothetical protein
MEGLPVGEALGLDEGPTVGCLVGKQLGCALGFMVGIPLGDEDGCIEGTTNYSTIKSAERSSNWAAV